MPYFPFNMFPYSNLHNLNLDWMLMTIQALTERIMQYEGSATPYDDAPLMDGTASPGAAFKYARGDHRHPSDTTKMGIEQYYQDYGGERTGYPATENGTVGASVKWAHEDHSHPHDVTKLDKNGGHVTGDLYIDNLLQIDGRIVDATKRVSANLSAAGWYRVVSCSQSGSIIKVKLGTGSAQTTVITIYIAAGNAVQIHYENESYEKIFDQVRVNLGSGNYHVDIHKSTSNTAYVTIDIEAGGNAIAANVLGAASLSPVALSPVGESNVAYADIYKVSMPVSAPGSAITNGTIVGSTTFSYTASQACWFYYMPVLMASGDSGFTVSLNNVEIVSYSNSGTMPLNVMAIPIPMQAGDTLAISQNTTQTSNYRVITMRGES